MTLYLLNPICVCKSCVFIVSLFVFITCCVISFLSVFYIGPVDVSILAKCNPCLSNPCKNDGTCSNHPVDFYRCTCPYGFKVLTHKNISLKVLPRY